MTTRSALPQNHIRDQAILFEDFESLTGWSATSGSRSLDTTNYKTGSAGLKVTVTSGGGWGIARKAITTAPPKLDNQITYIWIYLHDAPADYTAISLYFSGSSPDTIYKYYPLYGSSLVAGWNRVYLRPESWYSAGGATFDMSMTNIQVAIRGATGKTPSVSFDSLYMGQRGHPMCLLTFDSDVGKTIYSTAYPIIAAAGKRGTLFCWPNSITGDATHLSLADLQALYAAGWDIGNHGASHIDFTASTEEDCQDSYNGGRDYLIENDMLRAADHFAYPLNSSNASTDAIIAALGCKTSRGVVGRARAAYPYQQSGSMYELSHGLTMNSTISEATIDSTLNEYLLSGRTLVVMLHGVEDALSNSLFCTISRFNYLLNGLLSRGYQIKTITEWYEGLTNPRYRTI